MGSIARLAVRLLLVLMLLPVAQARAEGALERAAARGGLVAAANPDVLPLAARDASGKLVGFDIEVATEIARRLQLPVTFVTPGWEAILRGDWGGRWDYSVSNITPTDERSRRLEFPVDYRFEAVVAVVHRDNDRVQAPADLKGMRIGVARETTFEQYLTRNLMLYAGDEPPEYQIENPVIRRFPDKKEALVALARGDGAVLDAVVTSYATLQAATDQGLAVKAVPGFLFWEPVSVAVASGDDAFAERVEEAVEAMYEDGTLGDLSVKWFGIDMTAPLLP